MKKPANKRKVTTVSLPLGLYEKAKELDINVSAVVRESLMKKLTIEGEKEVIRTRIDELYKEIDYWSGKLEKLEEMETRFNQEQLVSAIESLKSSYNKVGKIRSTQLEYWALKVRIDKTELMEHLESNIGCYIPVD